MITERYTLENLTGTDRWVFTDTWCNLVCHFEQGKFNPTQRYTFLDDFKEKPDAQELAKIVNAMANWLSVFHYDIAMGVDDSFVKPTTTGADGVDVGAFIFPIENMTERLRIGRMVQYYRAKAGLTQQDLADLIGITRTSVTKIETGQYNVSVDILHKILKPLHVKLMVE